MPNNNPISWPPAPEAEKARITAPPVRPIMGAISLCMAILQLCALTFIAIMVFNFDSDEVGILYTFSLPVQVVWSICSIVFGVKGRQSVFGRIGWPMSAVMLLAILAHIIFGWVSSSD